MIKYQNEKAVLEHLKVVKKFDVVTLSHHEFKGTATQMEKMAKDLVKQNGVIAVEVMEK